MLFNRSARARTRAPEHQRGILSRHVPLLAVALGVTILLPAVRADAATAPVGLGAATSFGVLAGSGITNTGPTTVTGDVGTFPTPSETGLGTMTEAGTNHDGDAVTQQAKNDLTTGYNAAAGSGPATAVATELGGRTLTPGVYNGPTLGITGTLTLNTLGDPNAVFIFQAASTLITASTSSVIVLNGATACNVFWQVGSSATLGTNSHIIGSVMALTSITATTGATISGRLLARNGAVTLDTNTITVPTCAAASSTSTTSASGTNGSSSGSPKAKVSSPNATHLSTGKTPAGTLTNGSIPPGNLALTGFNPRMPLLVGGLFITFGSLLLVVSNRRRASR